MSEFRDILQDTVKERHIGTAEECRHLRTGAEFVAEYEEITPLDVLTELGADDREASRLHILDRATAADIRQGDGLAVKLYGEWHQFTAVKRENNPGSPTVVFTLKYLVPGQDT